MTELFDPARHESLTATPWNDAQARASIARICAAAESEFDPRSGSWLLHPQDDPPAPVAPSFNLYWGAASVV